MQNEEQWKNTLIGYVVGSKPFIQHLKVVVIRLWKPMSNMQIISRESGFF